MQGGLEVVASVTSQSSFVGEKMKKSIWLCTLSIFVLASALFAQDTSGKISGTVLDPSGSGVPGAKVTVTNTDRNLVVRTVTTDSSGIYSAPIIPVGSYALK